MFFYAAPMEGITSYIWRNAHHHYYPGIKKYYTPFLSPKKKRGWTTREKNELLPEHNKNIPLIPQVLTNSAEAFVNMAQRLLELGYREVNLNLGCPSGTVVSKGKGSGFLKEPEELKHFFGQVFGAKELPIKVSVKTRLGVERPEEIMALIDIYNQFPVSEVVIHARVQKDMYKKPVRQEMFREAFQASRHPVCYNGDIFSAEDAGHFAKRFPEVKQVMLGRGLISNPQLQEMIEHHSGKDMIRLQLFHDEVCGGYEEIMSGDRNVLFKMKELCSYMFSDFSGAEKFAKRIRKCGSLSDYRGIVKEWFSFVTAGGGK